MICCLRVIYTLERDYRKRESNCEDLLSFAMCNALPCMMHKHVFGPNFQRKKSFVLIF